MTEAPIPVHTRRRHRAALILTAGLVLLLSGALRMVHPGLYELWSDETLTQYHGVQLARHGEWVWVGNPMSTGQTLYHSPFGVYLDALPYLFSSSVLGPRLLYGLLGTAAVAAALIFVRRYYGWPAALLAGAMVAVNPLAVDWSRFAWHPSAAEPLLVLWILTGALGYIEGKRWAQVAHWLLLSGIAQADTALAAIAPLSLGLVVWKRAWNRTTLLAFGLVLLTLIPWAIGLIGAHQGWIEGPPPNDLGRSIKHFAVPPLSTTVRWVAALTSRYDYNLTTLALSDKLANWWPDERLNVLLVVHTLIVLVGAVYLARRGPVDRWVVALLVWPLGFLFFSREVIFDFYLMATVLAADLIFGIVFGALWRWHRWTLVLALILIAAQAWVTLAFLDHKQRSDHEYPMSDIQSAVQTWLRAGDEIVVLDEPDSEAGGRYRWEWVMKWRIFAEQYPIRVVTEPSGIVLGAERVTLVGPASGTLIPSLVGEGTVVSVARRTFRWASVAASDLARTDLGPGGQFGDLMRVVGALAEPSADETWPLVVVWEPLRGVSEQYQFSARLIGEDGQSYGQTDGPSLEPAQWRTGDLVLTRLLMPPVPADAAWHLDLLLYRWPEISNVPLAGQDRVILTLAR